MPPRQTTIRRTDRARSPLLLAAIAALVALLATLGGHALAQDLQGQVEQKRQQLEQANREGGVLSSDISRLNRRVERLTGQVAALRNREAKVQAELDEAEARLQEEKRNLQILRERLARSIDLLERRLVAIYKSDDPDAMSVILQADGYDDLVERSEYLRRIEDQDSAMVFRVRQLRDDTRETVERVRATRDSIRTKKAELERTRASLEQREAALAAARDRSRAQLAQIRARAQRLDGEIGDLEDRIQAQLAASQQPDSSGGAAAPAPAADVPAGPVRSGSGGMIWPVNGPVTSPFGMRWGRLHAGIDIGVPAGTPIRAAKAGTIAFARWTGGYGNYTCINHGGGLSTCYAHLSSYSVTSGSVGQGQVIGLVGCTGSCFGDHLHFEVRINGSPVDPMGYL